MGGAEPYRKGAAFEREVIAYLEGNGWYCIRSAGSKSIVDIIAFSPWPWTCVYQCKLHGEISNAKWNELYEFGKTYNVTAYLVSKMEEGINFEPILERKPDRKTTTSTRVRKNKGSDGAVQE